MAHEYIEQGLMSDGMPYRSLGAWGEHLVVGWGNNPSPQHHGAHDIAPNKESMIAKAIAHHDAVDDAIARIQAITWEPNYSRVGSHVLLLREYLRRAALWTKALDCTHEWPFFNVAAYVNPSLRADPIKVGMLKKHFDHAPFYVSGVIERTCGWFVQWAVVKDRPEATSFGLPDPFEPLILMYERGGIFTTENSFFDFVGFALPKGRWGDHYGLSPIIELNREVLDQIDAEWNSK
jgi:hypothetical protein